MRLFKVLFYAFIVGMAMTALSAGLVLADWYDSGYYEEEVSWTPTQAPAAGCVKVRTGVMVTATPTPTPQDTSAPATLRQVADVLIMTFELTEVCPGDYGKGLPKIEPRPGR